MLYRTLERFEGQVTWRALEARPGGGADARGRRARAVSRSRRSRCRASRRFTSRGCSPPTPRTTSACGSASGRRAGLLAYASAVGRITPAVRAALADARLRVLRRHVLVERRADRARARHEARRGHGARARRRRGRAAWRASPVFARHAGSTSTSTTPTRSCARTRPSGRWPRPRAGRSPGTAWRSSCDARPPRCSAGRSSSNGCGARASAATTTTTRYHVLMHEGRAHAAPAPAVGAEPLLLPDPHPHQGRDHPLEVRGSGVPAHVDPPHPRPRRRAGRRGRARAVAAAGRRRRARSRGGRELPLRAPRACASPATATWSWCASARSSRLSLRRSPSSSRPT